MQHKWFFAISFLVLAICLPAKSMAKSMEWGEIPKADLIMTHYSEDTSAKAVILGDIGRMAVYRGDDGYEYSLIRHKRIKILNKKGFTWADISIPFYQKDNIEEINTIKAQIISPSGKKYELSRKDFFQEKINDSWSQIKFTFPNLEEGAVIEYRYQLISKDVVQLQTWYFHNELPTRFSELRLIVDAAFSYATLFQGGEEMEKTVLDDGTTILKSNGAEMRLKNGYYLMQNAPAFREEAFISNIDSYRARIRFQLQEVQYPDGFKKSFLSTWEQVAEDLLTDQEFGAQFLKKRNYKDILEAFSAVSYSFTDSRSVVDAVYEFIGRKMTWNGRYGIYAKEDLNTVFERRIGSGVELNLIALALLKEAGVSAYPLLSATRSYGKMLRDYPIIDQFNHMMVLVQLDDGNLILDIPNPNRPPGLPEMNSLNSYAWLVNEKKPEWISIAAPLGTDDFRSLIKIDSKGQVACQMNMRFSNYNAVSERSYYFSDPKGAYWTDRLARRIPHLEIERFEVKYPRENQRPFINNLVFRIEEAAQQAGDFLYLMPVLYSNFHENPFKQDIRYYPVDFPYPFEEKYTTTIMIPEKYKVESLPAEVTFELEGSAGFFKYQIEQKAKRITLSSHLQITALKIPPENYPALKQMLDIFLEKQEEPIVLKIVD